MITQSYLKSVLNYDPEAGVFTWASKRRATKIGKVAGRGTQENVYRCITIDCKRYGSHQLAWLHFYGYIPDCNIDHKNGIKSDNRIDNLRLATIAQNGANRPPNKNNKTGVKGVCRKSNGCYLAQVMSNGRRVTKNFTCIREAKEWIHKKRSMLHGDFANNHGA